VFVCVLLPFIAWRGGVSSPHAKATRGSNAPLSAYREMRLEGQFLWQTISDKTWSTVTWCTIISMWWIQGPKPASRCVNLNSNILCYGYVHWLYCCQCLRTDSYVSETNNLLTEDSRTKSHSFWRFDVFTSVTMKNYVFWDVMPCVSCKNRRFGGTYCLRHQGDKNQQSRNKFGSNYQLKHIAKNKC
jgi:hypothetical protein